MRPGARSIARTAFGLLMAAGGALVAVPPAAASTTTTTLTAATATVPTRTNVPRSAVSTLSHVRGPVAGGTAVTITGGSLGSATAVRFGQVSAQFRKVQANGVVTLVATTPPHPMGTVAVT